MRIKTVRSHVTSEIHNAFINFQSSSSAVFVQRLGVVTLMLAVSLFTASCGTAAQAAGSQNTVAPKSLSLSGNLPSGTVHGAYNAVLAVGGGQAPYHFSVKTGALPPGISLDPATGAFSGKPAAA